MVKDTHELQNFNAIQFPKLKGHVKLTLHNVHNKKNEVYEGDNIVTYAVRDIFASNFLGGINYNSCMPLWSTWYGGVLCYQNAHPTTGGVLDPANYYPKNSTNNPVTAHAGGSTIDPDHDDDLTRGNPTTSAFQYTETSVKQVWEWGTSHGNGSISAVSLTHKDTGDAGLGSTSYAFQHFSPLANISNLANISMAANNNNAIYTQYDDNHGLMFLIGAESGTDSYPNNASGFDNGTYEVTVFIRKLPYNKSGLFERVNNPPTERTFTVTTTSTKFYWNPAYYFDYENKKLWLFTNVTARGSSSNYNHQVVNYCVIDCENETVDSESTITSDVPDLAPMCMQNKGSAGFYIIQPNIIKDGDYVYLPMSNGVSWDNPFNAYFRGYKKIKLTEADQTAITLGSSQPYMKTIMKCGDFLVGSRIVVNGTTAYTCGTDNDCMPVNDYNLVYALNQPYNVLSYCTAIYGFNTSNTFPRYMFANKMVNTTLFNLPSTVTKSASQSMTVEYTLQQVEPNSGT